MFSLNFYQEYDAYHAAFRVVRLRSLLLSARPADSYRIVDYFLCFPFELGRLRLGRGMSRHRQVAARYEYRRPYRYALNAEQVALQMWPFQQVALKGMANLSLLDASELARERVRWADESPSQLSGLDALADEVNAQETDLLELLEMLLERYPTTGPESLKARSHLLPTQYDVRTSNVLG